MAAIFDNSDQPASSTPEHILVTGNRHDLLRYLTAPLAEEYRMPLRLFARHLLSLGVSVAGERSAHADTDESGDSAAQAVAVASGAFTLLSANLLSDVLPEPTWEIAHLASQCAGEAHGLDDGTAASLLVLRAAALATGTPVPSTGPSRRELWLRIGVSTDTVSGTLIV